MKNSWLANCRPFSALVLLCASTLCSVSADEAADPPRTSSILQRLPIGFRTVARSAKDGSTETSGESSAPLPLAPRGRASANESTGAAPSVGRAIATVASSLAVVAGLLIVVTWFARRYHPAVKGLPPELFLHLGTTNIAGRQTMHVMRFGDKLLLVAASPSGLRSLAELTNLEDVERLTALCGPTSSNPIASTFQRVVADWTRESSRPHTNPRATRPIGTGVTAAVRMGEASHA